MTNAPRRAFTLIELLVVVSIIVILIALIAPALDKAIYHAELAVCGARQRAVGTTSFMYLNDYKRFYPSRPVNYGWDALFLRHPATNKKYPTTDGGTAVPFDLRTPYESYGTLDMFLDPMSPAIKLDDVSNMKQGGLTGYQGDVHIYANYFVYSGWAPKQNEIGVSNQRLSRLGGRWTVTDGWGEPNQTSHSLSILVADRDDQIGYGFSFSPHPHPTGEQDFEPIQYQARDTVPDDGTTVVLGGQFVATTSYWQGVTNNPNTIKGDYNYTYTDGSVRLIRNVRYDDDRMIRTQVTQWSGPAGDPGYVQGRHNKLPRD